MVERIKKVERVEGIEPAFRFAPSVNASQQFTCVFSTVETDPNPGLPWPQPGDTLLPGWGDRVSMEYRLRVASEEECLEWAKELWQLELVAKARGYPKNWAVQTSRNRLMWMEAFAAREECRAPNFEQLSEAERV